MSSHLHAELTRARQVEIASDCAQAARQHELRVASERPPRLRSTGRKWAAAAVAGLALAWATVACGGVADRTQHTVAQTADSGTPVPALHTSTSLRTFALMIRELEARGYVQASCGVSRILMVNPHTHRTVTVFA
jgi:hypothetical protein